jgi:hypothetical protein
MRRASYGSMKADARGHSREKGQVVSQLANRLLLLVSLCWLAFGCLALAGLARVLDNQLVAWVLMVPAMLLGLLAPPGWFYQVSEGWPILTFIGVAAVYVAPGTLLLAVSRLRRR